MTIPWGDIATVSTLALVGLGVAAALIPNLPRRVERCYFVLGFLLFGGITWYAQDEDRSDYAKQIAYETRGGDGYCYFHLNVANVSALDGPYQLFMEGVGNVQPLNYWLSPAWTTTDGKQPEYYSLDRRKSGLVPCPTGTRASDRALPKPDEYRVEFDAPNGHWDEFIKIAVVDGKLTQHITVKGAKGKVLRDAND